MEINLSHILLVLVVILLFAIFVRLGSIAIQISRNQEINNAYNNDQHSQRGKLLQTQCEHLEEISSNVQQLQSDIEDMKFVADVFYKYKLPDKKERDLLDQIAIDNEVSDGIAELASYLRKHPPKIDVCSSAHRFAISFLQTISRDLALAIR